MGQLGQNQIFSFRDLVEHGRQFELYLKYNGKLLEGSK